MESESFEFELSQYLDGDLTPDRRAEIERRLQSDPSARAMLDDFTKIDYAARAAAGPLPEIKWDDLAARISRTVAKEAHRPMLLFRWPVRAGLALAASLLVVAGIWLTHPAAPLAPPAELLVIGPQADAAAGPSVIDVSVGRPQAAETAADFISSDSVLVRPSLVALDGFATAGTNQYR
jgi:anti-sigma factor RsiW